MSRSCNSDLKEMPEKTYKWLEFKKEVISIVADLVTETLFDDCLDFLTPS